MFGSIYIGLTGLNAYSRGLQAVSNNVTNLNTSGFKGSTVSFQNFYGTGDDGGLSYTVDSHDSGNGVGMGDSMLNMKQGELRQTDRDLDLAVDGTGFLVLMDGKDMLYTRTGSFEVDKEGYIVLSGTEYRLATLDKSGRPVAVSIDASRTSAPKQTSKVVFADNLSSTTDDYTVSDVKVYDKSGGLHTWKIRFKRDTSIAGNNWKVAVVDDKNAVIGATARLSFNPAGKVEESTKTLSFTDATNGFTVDFDFSGAVTSFSSGDVVSLRTASVDGNAVGAVTTITVNATGELELGYSNEEKVKLGAVAIADFRDSQSLTQRSGGIFAYDGTGEHVYLASSDPRVGKVMSKRLEASNVDLSKEFGDLILIQRGFQAASQIVSVSNDMIQQLFGIRGQG
ncbi:MAG: flagellar hook-basal body complex protein [Pseudomonadota bacterium]